MLEGRGVLFACVCVRQEGFKEFKGGLFGIHTLEGLEGLSRDRSSCRRARMCAQARWNENMDRR